MRKAVSALARGINTSSGSSKPSFRGVSLPCTVRIFFVAGGVSSADASSADFKTSTSNDCCSGIGTFLG